MNDNVKFEQFTMFNLKQINSNIIYWENALSYSNDIPKFIELIDGEPATYFRISSWQNLTKTINLEGLKQSTGFDLLDKRTLYISNSFTMAFEMCFERYCQRTQLDQSEFTLDLKNIKIKKDIKDVDFELDNNAVFCAIAYINDFYENGEINLLNNQVSFKPKAGSVLIMPAQEVNTYSVNSYIGERYVASTLIYKNNIGDKNE